MKEKTQDIKSQILKATLEVIADQGFHGTSVSQIAKKASVNVGSMYYHFANKDDILIALYIDCKAKITEHAFQNCSHDIIPEQRLMLMTRNIIAFFLKNKEFSSFMEQFENSPYFAGVMATDEYKSVMKPYMEMYEQMVLSFRIFIHNF